MHAVQRLLALLLLLTVGLAATPAAAQEDEPDISRIEQLSAELGGSGDGDSGGLEPVVISPDVLGEEGAEVQRQALTAYYQYRIDGYRHRGNVFRWQLLSSRIIFVMVILLVVAGVYFSWLQFRAALKSGAGSGEAQETTFEASASGFKISSPVLGVIILAISLAFFYLYLVHVYPITEIF